MTLEKAIEILTSFNHRQWRPDLYDTRDAIRLGIEAMTFIQMSRVTSPGSVPTLLHGETQAPLPG